MELFSALDNVLSQKAEDTLTEFAAVKKADVQLQTPLGNRQAQIGINIMGAFAESQNSAFGWQVRVYGGENDSKGANAGIFFRRVDGESLYGINSFADYEKGDYGEFLRYGIGGELQNRYASFAMNYYLPITDDKHNGAQVAFSQKGYDANLRINIPQLDFLKVRADYYHYDGDYGVKEDNGFRYGMELQPLAGLQLGVFYDDGGEKFGGDIVYVYNIAAHAKRESKDAFSPDLFAPIVREYSQRIITATTGPQIEVLRIATATITRTEITPAITTRMTTETTMIADANNIARAASVHFTTRINNPASFAGYVIATTQVKYLITLPPASQITRPLMLTISRIWLKVPSGSLFRVIMNFGSPLDVGTEGGLVANSPRILTLTVREGSEDYITPAGLMTTILTTATEMTIAAITTTITNILYRTETITIGLPTTNIGAAIDNSPLPPSFPLPIFPLSFPQLPKLALAAPVIPASAYARGGNQLAAGRRMLMAQSAI